MNFGNIALGFGVANGLVALPLYYSAARGRPMWLPLARLFLGLLALGVLAASIFQMNNILTHQFQYTYVSRFSDRELPTLLLATTFWAGQSGSFMLWSLWSVIFGLVLMVNLRHTAWEPFVLTPYLLVALCVTGIMWASGPFKLNDMVPRDGGGLNPLLQNYWMAIHPPILFTGFTTMAGPFVFAVAALWRRDYDGWVRMARPWTLLAWACMGTGLALGGFWAYESLGWGGFWGWDPVENSSFVPWLFASALLHGLVIQSARGSMKRTNLLLAVFSYMTVVYSTFLTRSGVLGNFSIHSFVDLGLMNFLLVFITLFAILGFGMLLWRWRQITKRVIYTHVLSREFGLLVSVALFVIIALMVGIGTSMPIISLLPGFGRQVSVDLGWYGPNIAPFGLLLLLTMAIGPLLGWQKSRYGSLLKLLRWPAIFTAVSLFVALLLNIIYPVALLFLAATVFAVTTNALIISRIWRAGPLRLGGYLAHIGVGLLFMGVVGTALYKQSVTLRLVEGTPQTVFGQQFTLRGMVQPTNDELKRTAIQVEVMDPERRSTWVAQAPYYIYKTGQQVMHPAIQSGLWSDLYLAPSQFDMPNQVEPGLLYMGQQEAKKAFGYTVQFEDFDLPNRDAMIQGKALPEVLAILKVTAPDGTVTTVKPAFKVNANQKTESPPVALPGGATIALETVDPASQLVAVRFGKVDLASVPAEELKSVAFVEVSREPGIKLVWFGCIISILGGLLALVRRWRETGYSDVTTALPMPQPLPQPEAPALQPGLAHLTIAENEAAT